jgi:putative ABC transport system permease protein
MAFFLSFKEVWRNKGRFFLFSLVIALITILVLLVAALAEGLAQANKQYLEKINADLLVFQENVDLVASSSRLGRSLINDINRVEGVQAVGPIGFSSVATTSPVDGSNLNISIIGVEPGKPGAPPVIAGENILTDRGFGAVIDMNLVNRAGYNIGDTIRVRSTQGNEEEYYNLRVIGITEPRQYLYAPSVFIPYRTWDQIRPQGGSPSSLVELTSNVIAVRLADKTQQNLVNERIIAQVPGVEVADIKASYEALPGYTVQQQTLNTQQLFVLLIGTLVIGGFFQIQMLQKVPQIGVLKAIGASNRIVATAVVTQIILVTSFGVILGGLLTLGLAAGIPPVVPIQFSGNSVMLAIAALLAIGPIGGLVSVRLAISVEPLIALGLSS